MAHTEKRPALWTPAPPGEPQARVRMLGDAILFACPGMQNTTQRHALTLLYSTTGKLLRASTAGQTAEGTALLIAPMALKTIHALDCPLVLVDVEPSHPRFRTLARPGAPAIQALDTPICAEWAALARAFAQGALQGHAVDSGTHQWLDALARQWPTPAPMDARVATLMGLIDENPGAELEQLAPLLDLSPHHASRLFGRDARIPLRRYALSVKIRAAASFMGSGLALTHIAQAAGFVDSAHFAKVWAQCYGAAPSRFFDAATTHIDTSEQPDWLMWYLARRKQGLPQPLPDAPSPWVHRPRKARSRAAEPGTTSPAKRDNGASFMR